MSSAVHEPCADLRRLERLRWKARRGLLENDLLLAPFMQQALATLAEHELQTLEQLLQLGDNALLALLMGRAVSDDLHQAQLVNRIRSTSSN